MVYKNILKSLFLFFCFFAIGIDLAAYEKYDEYLDVDDLEESLYCFSRYAFPATCIDHFSNNVGIKHTWMEAESLEDINFFSDYLYTIPKIYDADCCHCYSCNGVGFSLYRGYLSPTDDVDAFHELCNGHVQSKRGYGKRCNSDGDNCEPLCWSGGYFRLWNHKHLSFFKHYLQYCSENEDCQCYWPECDLDAMNINNSVYDLLKELAEEGLITHEFSSYWQASMINFDYHGKVYTDLYYPNSHGMASSLTNYTFFYSQYHQMLLSVAEFIDTNSIKGNSTAIDKLYAKLEDLRNEFTTQYNMCLRSHPHPKIYYERGMLRMHSGNAEDALMDVNRLMRMAKTDRYINRMILTSEMYQQEGTLYADLGIYDKAIDSLSEAIRLDPNNRGAYFIRAQAYFESGGFEQSLNDYLESNNNVSLNANLKPHGSLRESILIGLQEGGIESLTDFVPSLCNSVYGLHTTMCGFSQYPVSSAIKFLNACYDIGNCINEFRKDVDPDEFESYPLEIQRLFTQYDRLSESERGHQVGYIVGKYGIDIFAGGTAIKAIANFKKLRDANTACKLEAMAANKEAIIASALKHKTERDLFFKNVQIHLDRQNKHIPGKHNFQEGKSIFTYSDPQILLEKFGGKGKKIRGDIGKCGYQEIIDFGEEIGYNVSLDKVKTPTTWGKIHYSKEGAHIVPTTPRKS